MALVATNTSAQARRLELDGFSRVGQNAVETNFDKLKELLDREDISISKIVLHRKNGDKEEEIINDFIKQELEGKYKQIKGWKIKNWGKIKPKPSIHTVFELDEHKLKILREFNQILDKELPLREKVKDKYVEDNSWRKYGNFEQIKEKHVERWKKEKEEAENDEELGKAERKLEEAKDLEKEDCSDLL